MYVFIAKFHTFISVETIGFGLYYIVKMISSEIWKKNIEIEAKQNMK